MKKFGIKRATELRNASEFSNEEINELKAINYSDTNTENNKDTYNPNSENQTEINKKDEKMGK